MPLHFGPNIVIPTTLCPYAIVQCVAFDGTWLVVLSCVMSPSTFFRPVVKKCVFVLIDNAKKKEKRMCNCVPFSTNFPDDTGVLMAG